MSRQAARARRATDHAGGVRILVALILCGVSAPLSALIGGQPDTDGRYASVVSLRIAPDRRCTATKIAPRTFLTAAHCVIDIPTGELARPFQPGGEVQVSNSAEPAGSTSYQTLVVAQTRLPPAFATALKRLHAYQEGQIADFRTRYQGEDLTRRIAYLHQHSRITDRFPDLALVQVRTATPAIAVTPVDLNPLAAGAPVVLVGYGCERVADLALGSRAPVRRTWGASRVIRVDAVNFYSFAPELSAGTPALCPGDSGGPVLRDGRVVGVHGTVWGLGAQDSARSNMSVNLAPLGDWDAWPRPGASLD